MYALYSWNRQDYESHVWLIYWVVKICSWYFETNIQVSYLFGIARTRPIHPKIQINSLHFQSFKALNLTLFRSGGYQISTSLPFSLYLRHGFCSESEKPDRNRVNMKSKKKRSQNCSKNILKAYIFFPRFFAITGVEWVGQTKSGKFQIFFLFEPFP